MVLDVWRNLYETGILVRREQKAARRLNQKVRKVHQERTRIQKTY
jgi:hypothetical protein